MPLTLENLRSYRGNTITRAKSKKRIYLEHHTKFLCTQADYSVTQDVPNNDGM